MNSPPKPADTRARARHRLPAVLALLGVLSSMVPGPLPWLGLRAAIAGVKEDRKELEQAWHKYRENNTHQALDAATEIARRRNLDGTELRDAWVLKGLCESDLGNHVAAVASFKEVLTLDPTFQVAGTDYTPGEIADFRKARDGAGQLPGLTAATAGQRKSKTKYFLIGGGVLAVAVAVALVVGSHRGNPALPDFPDPPGSSR